MNTILLILCNALSCFIISNILFQFMNGKYKRSSQNRYAYIVIEAVTVIFTTCINMLNHSILNLVVWGVLTGIIAYALYYEDMDKPLRRIIECEALVFCMSVCESLGVILLQCILQAADIKNVNEMCIRDSRKPVCTICPWESLSDRKGCPAGQGTGIRLFFKIRRARCV